MKLYILSLLLASASAFVNPQRAFTRSTTVVNAEPSEKDLELTRKVILDYVNKGSTDEPKAEAQAQDEAPKKKKKGKKDDAADE